MPAYSDANILDLELNNKFSGEGDASREWTSVK